ncbi:MAG: acetyl-CoA decarbonylase/synthase complex subunit gamma [Bacteroidetes bacterium]|nr:acetyl-CoA decarbonylase/synthase complex subunit gamma [Bacteroidota bacterium]MCL5026528.1 acetyl-CoA decarbonylase/synthase complex subunit gamma [Chloroflexota bacterium]
MALTGLQIYKLLPKTNCKECGVPTCLAFAMKLATKSAELSACPYVTEEAKNELEAASAPPVRLVSIGADGRKIEVGNETVLYRHDKTFYHQPGLVVRVKDTQSADEIKAVADAVCGYCVERVGLSLNVDGVAIENASGDTSAFAKAIEVVGSNANVALVLMSSVPATLDTVMPMVADRRPLLYAADAGNWQAMAEVARKYKSPLAVKVDCGDLSALATLTEDITKAGVTDLMLDPGTRSMVDSLQAMTKIRRLALRKNFRPLGFPMISFPGEGASSPLEEVAAASQHIAKYGGVIVLDHFDPTLIYPLLTLRQNIYTDPQKPIQVKPDVYPIHEPDANSPLLITTNFSLTYFTVAGEVEASGVPAWLLIADSEGLSVLTAWAAGKFDAEKIKKAVQTSGILDKIAHKRLIIPGYVAGMSGEIEEELPGWEIRVGPREAVDLSSYLKSLRS